MRLLADENFPRLIVDTLRAGGHDVLWARTDCAGWTDPALLEHAEAEGRLLLTLDKDFWQIALQRRSRLKHSGVVLFRVHPATIERLDPLVRVFLEADLSWTGSVSTLEPGRIQILEIPGGN